MVSRRSMITSYLNQKLIILKNPLIISLSFGFTLSIIFLYSLYFLTFSQLLIYKYIYFEYFIALSDLIIPEPNFKIYPILG